MAGAVGLWFATGTSLPAQLYEFGTLAGDPSIVDPGGNPEGGVRGWHEQRSLV